MYGAIVAAMLTTTAPAAPDWCWWGGFGCGPGVYPAWCGYYAPWYGCPVAPSPVVYEVPPAPAPARVVVKLPEDARLFIDEDPCPLTSAKRSFDTPELQPGLTYHYTIRAEVTRAGRAVKVSKRVTVRAGQETVVEFIDMRSVEAASR